MRILVVGASGLLGTAVSTALEDRGHAVVKASRHTQPAVDLDDPESIRALYADIAADGQILDAVACAAGSALFKPLHTISAGEIEIGICSKLLGQVELVRAGVAKVQPGGSFTLVSGITSAHPIAGGSVMSMVNSGIDGFARGASADLAGRFRVNSVSATVFTEALDVYGDVFPGFAHVPVGAVAQAYVTSVEGVHNGYTFRVGY